jgi:flavodoxin
MKSLVVFYSRTGNTRRVAKLLTSELKAKLEEIDDIKRRDGLVGYLRTNWDAALKRAAQIMPPKSDPRAFDLVVVGTPIWNWAMSAPIRSFLADRGRAIRAVAFFCTMGNAGEAQVFAEMQELCGQAPIESFAFSEKSIADGSFELLARAFAAKVKARFGVA